MAEATRPLRLLAFHLTKPSNSEAKVLAALLSRLGPGFQVTLVVNRNGDDDEASHLRALEQVGNVDVVHANVGLPPDPWMPPSRIKRMLGRGAHRWHRRWLLRGLSRLPFDVVYTSQQRFDCRMGELLSKDRAIPHVLHLHYTVGPYLRRPVLRRLTTCDHVIAISEYIGQQALDAGVDPSRLTVIPNTIEVGDVRERPCRTGSELVVGQVGRMFEGKGFPQTISAFARLHEVLPTARLMVVGDGPDRGSLERLVDDAGIRSVVQFTGWQEDVRPWLDRFDVFLHPSLAEPFGLSVLEAMARGLPVIAYRDGGVPEIIEDGVSGVLVEPGDEDDLAKALMALGTDIDARRRIGRAAIERVRAAYDPRVATRRFEQTLARVTGRSRPD
jgi:glycosyltransferase involved in cell wall biosynthesis